MPRKRGPSKPRQAESEFLEVRRVGSHELRCGHMSKGLAPVSNPERWFCCGAWQTRKRIL